ncbi:hypothetical protein VL20_1291 [Microcystis panniformis FACHB-1757]|uniref:Uncharacterized protein n=1 Tax=Microcystis panniformis FACHB-1757 TaxID=1638788 RepID=A0A0K1RXM0_9CHRO|nr:hypothetical protein VL20_1291 [Microcystis panniformis FACHB-1757]
MLAKIFRFFCPQKVPNIRAIGGKILALFPRKLGNCGVD